MSDSDDEAPLPEQNEEEINAVIRLAMLGAQAQFGTPGNVHVQPKCALSLSLCGADRVTGEL